MSERQSATQKEPTTDHLFTERIEELIQQHPTFGYRRLWAVLRFRDGLLVNRKTVYHILKVKGPFCHERRHAPRLRVRGLGSHAEKSNQRWAMDLTHVHCGADGWGHLAAVIDCHDREIVGYEFSLRGRAKEAERALEEACIARFGTLRPEGDTPVLRSDNGLIFQSRRFRAALRDYRLRQEFITPYTPEQNGMIERFFRSLKEECVWQHLFQDFAEARRTIPGLDPLVQRGAAPSEPQLPESGRVPGPTTTTGGLKSGEHYRSRLRPKSSVNYPP